MRTTTGWFAEAGDGGGRAVAAGTPEDVARCKESYTGQYLRELLGRRAGGTQASRAGGTQENRAGGTQKDGSANGRGKRQAAE